MSAAHAPVTDSRYAGGATRGFPPIDDIRGRLGWRWSGEVAKPSRKGSSRQKPVEMLRWLGTDVGLGEAHDAGRTLTRRRGRDFCGTFVHRGNWQWTEVSRRYLARNRLKIARIRLAGGSGRLTPDKQLTSLPSPAPVTAPPNFRDKANDREPPGIILSLTPPFAGTAMRRVRDWDTGAVRRRSAALPGR